MIFVWSRAAGDDHFGECAAAAASFIRPRVGRKRPLSPDGVQPAARANSETRAILEIKNQIECISPRNGAQMNERTEMSSLYFRSRFF